MEDEIRTHIYSFMGTDRIPIAPNVWIRWLFDNDYKLSLEVVVGPDTTEEDITKAWRLIREERDALVNHLGIGVSGYFRCLILMLQDETYSEWFLPVWDDDVNEYPEEGVTARKPSYRDLAVEVNFDLLLFALHNFKNGHDKLFAKSLLMGLLAEFDWDKEVIANEIEQACEELSENRCPWDISEYPINEGKVREKIRYIIKTEKKFGRKIISPTYSLSDLRTVFFHEFVDAKHFLQKTYPLTYKRYKNRISAMYIEMLKAKCRLRDSKAE